MPTPKSKPAPTEDTATQPVTAESLGWQLRGALPLLRLNSVSLYDLEGEVLWLSEGALGPDEHGFVLEALATLRTGAAAHCDRDLQDGRAAVFLAVRAPQGELVGVVMILVDSKAFSPNGLATRVLTAQVRAILQRMAVLLRPQSTHPAAEVPVAAAPAIKAPAAPAPGESEAKAGKPPSGGAPKITSPSATAAVAKPAKSAKASAPPPKAGARPAAPEVPTVSAVPEGLLPPTLQPAEVVTLEWTPPEPAESRRDSIELLSDSLDAKDVDDVLSLELKQQPAETPAHLARAPSPHAPAPSQPMRAPSQQMRAPSPPTRQPAKQSAPSPPQAPAPAPAQASQQVAQPTGRRASQPAARRVPQPVRSDPAPQVRLAPVAAKQTEVSAGGAPDHAPVSLYVQELTKLRPGGRTHRYQILPEHSLRNSADAVTREATEGTGGQQAQSVVAICRELVGWLGANRSLCEREPLSFSISVPAAALAVDQLPQMITATVRAAEVSPSCIGFELQEAACIRHRAYAEHFVREVERLGSFFVLDDFQFDSAAPELLRSKALRLVKADGKLISLALRDKIAQARLVAIAQAARVLGVHCAAKHVSAENTLRWLTAAGFDFAAGSLFDPPRLLDSLALASQSAT